MAGGLDRTERSPTLARAHAAQRRGDRAAAEADYRALLAADPEDADAWHGLGTLAHAAGRHREAVALIERALRARPRTGHFHIVLGAALAALGEHEAARAAFALAVLFEPADPRAHAGHGRALHALGRLNEARTALARARMLAPTDAAIAHASALLELAAARPADAAALFAAVGALRPDDPGPPANEAAALAAASRFAEADRRASAALGVAPDNVVALNARGLARAALGRLDDARADLARAVALAPGDPALRRNLASVLYERDERVEARRLLDAVLAADPTDRDAILNRGTIDLAEGNWAEGWRGWAARPGPRPDWGGAFLAGRALLLRAEQGLGDTIMLLRYVAPALARAGGPVLLALPDALHPLMAPVRGVTIVPADASAPAGAATARLGDLPALFSPHPSAVPPPPALVVDPEAVRRHRAALAACAPDRRLLGVAVVGNPAYRQDRRRSIDPARFAPFAALRGVALVPLVPNASVPGALALERGQADLADTAALLAAVDVVLTVDTAIVHLAGTLGRPTILLDRVGGDWRWLRGRADTPWYPSVRIVRDDAAHEPERAWIGPLRDVLEELRR